MSSGSRKSLSVGIFVIALMALFPPWDSAEVVVEETAIPGRRTSGKVMRLEPVIEYALFLSTPAVTAPKIEGQERAEVSFEPGICWDRLVLQWMIVLCASAAAALFFVPDPDDPGPEAGGEGEHEDEDEALVEEKLRAARAFQRSGKLKEVRRRMGLSPTDFAAKLGVKTQDVSHWERGKKQVPLKYAVLLLDLLNEQ